MNAIEARAVRKRFGRTLALDGVDLSLAPGRVLGLIGPNGSGKSTLLHALLGLTAYQGHIRVLGLEPWRERDRLMRDVCFIADAAVLPRWLTVAHAVDFMAAIHPRFNRARAETLLARTGVPRNGRVEGLSKGMVVQLHLALILSVEARLLVLDEPTLGLDLLFRKTFYDQLIGDVCEGDRVVVISTHDVDEVESVLTDVAFIDSGRVALAGDMEALGERFTELLVRPESTAEARALSPIAERRTFDRTVLLFDRVDRGRLERLGEVRRPGLADLFVALVSGQRHGAAA